MPIYNWLYQFGGFFWQVFCFWACWQVLEFVLYRLKVRLRKPWLLDQKSAAGLGEAGRSE